MRRWPGWAWPEPGEAGLDQPELAGRVHRLGAASRAELLHQVRDVELHRRVGDIQALADRHVAQPLREQAQDLPLPRRNLPSGLRVGLATQPAHYGARGARVERALTPVDGADRPGELGEVHVLHDVALRS